MLLVFVAYFVLLNVLTCQSASIHHNKRSKRGILSRSGICPDPMVNFAVRDTRLNFYGFQYLLPGDENPPCTETECHYDEDCHGDRKCCSNHCGAQVCTESERDPHPCANFKCPITKVCKVQRVKCIEPICPDMLAVSRPICVNGGPIYQMGKRSRIPRPNLRRYKESDIMNKPTEVVWNPKQPYYENYNYNYGNEMGK